MCELAVAAGQAGLGSVGRRERQQPNIHGRSLLRSEVRTGTHGCIIRRANSRHGDWASEAMRGRRRKVAVLPERSKTHPDRSFWRGYRQPCWLAGDGQCTLMYSHSTPGVPQPWLCHAHPPCVFCIVFHSKLENGHSDHTTECINRLLGAKYI